MVRFADRRQAGRVLGETLARMELGAPPVVLALPRGGVPVAYEVARALHAPLDVFVVRKLGTPGQPELAMGAIARGGVLVINDEVVEELAIPFETIQEVAREEQRELERREHEYRGNAPMADVHGRAAILVDDGIATGSTMRAGIAALRKMTPARLIVAVPVAARESFDTIEAEVDEVVCPLVSDHFYAVGAWYERFDQTSDDEVRELLERAHQEHLAAGFPGASEFGGP